MDVDLLSSSDESSFDDEDIMNDVTQPHACEAEDDKEVTQECIQDVWAACSWQQKKMTCRKVVLTENSTFVSNLTEAVPLDASQACCMLFSFWFVLLLLFLLLGWFCCRCMLFSLLLVSFWVALLFLLFLLLSFYRVVALDVVRCCCLVGVVWLLLFFKFFEKKKKMGGFKDGIVPFLTKASYMLTGLFLTSTVLTGS